MNPATSIDTTCPHCHMAQKVEIPSTRLDYFTTRCRFYDHIFEVELPWRRKDIRVEFFKLAIAEFIVYSLAAIFILACIAAVTILLLN